MTFEFPLILFQAAGVSNSITNKAQINGVTQTLYRLDIGKPSLNTSKQLNGSARGQYIESVTETIPCRSS